MNMPNLMKAPILEKLIERAEGYTSFHMPGHQRGEGLWPCFNNILKKYCVKLDLTEISGLDNLGAAQECICKSQHLMADLTGAVKTFYLVNGATTGLQAGLMAANQKQGKVLLPMHAHMSLNNALILTGGKAILLPVMVDEKWGIPLGVDIKLFNEDNKNLYNSEVLVTINPNYHGVVADLPAMKKWRENHSEVIWLVDEAHGAHFPYIKSMEGKEALEYGADLVIQSTHKMLGTLTQTALIHCGQKKWIQPIQQALNILQSSSPSYILLAALDSLQAYLHEEGKKLILNAEILAKELIRNIQELDAYHIWQDELPEKWLVDPCKITISPAALGLTGFQLSKILYEEYKIDVELATNSYILILITMGHKEEDCETLLTALREIKDKSVLKYAKHNLNNNSQGKKIVQYGQLIEPELSPRQIYYSQKHYVKLKDSIGQINAAAVVPYPPGIPLIYPGMIITYTHIEQIEDWLATGGTCLGIHWQDNKAGLLVCK